jgi:hypothetical protein
MRQDLICSWLELPAGSWPPDHYRLLGLEPGEGDPERIEEHVHERLETVRRYQLPHPEEVTEAMNRLAQAFVCLTDPRTKETYDRTVMGLEPVALQGAGVAVAGGPNVPGRSQVEWLYQPWARSAAELPIAEALAELERETKGSDSKRQAAQFDIPVLPAAAAHPAEAEAASPAPESAAKALEAPAGDSPSTMVASAPLLVAPPEKSTLVEVIEAARNSPAARRGLGTKRDFYHRLARTRSLLRAWQEAGKYLSSPRRRLTKPAEATDLIREMTQIRTGLEKFPPLLGAAGQPGYLVVSLARQQVVVPTYQTLLPSQRIKLAADWQLGLQLLAEHREFLRQELRLHRKKSPLTRAVLATRSFLDKPGGILLLVALLALNLAIWKSYFQTDWLHRSTPNGKGSQQHLEGTRAPR